MSIYYQLAAFFKTNAEVAKVLSYHPTQPGLYFGKELCIYRLQVPFDLQDGDRLEIHGHMMVSNRIHNNATSVRALMVGTQLWLEPIPPVWNSAAPVEGAVAIGEAVGGNMDQQVDAYRPIDIYTTVELLAGAAGYWIAWRAKCSSEAATISDRLVIIDSQGALYMKHWRKVYVEDAPIDS